MTTTLRTPAERAAGLERLGALAANPFFAEAARIEDAVALRKRLEAKLIVHAYSADARGNKVINYKAHEANSRTHLRIARLCDWAKRRMRRADEAYASRSVELELAA